VHHVIIILYGFHARIHQSEINISSFGWACWQDITLGMVDVVDSKLINSIDSSVTNGFLFCPNGLSLNKRLQLLNQVTNRRSMTKRKPKQETAGGTFYSCHIPTKCRWSRPPRGLRTPLPWSPAFPQIRIKKQQISRSCLSLSFRWFKFIPFLLIYCLSSFG
jgi:hypothetical protein